MATPSSSSKGLAIIEPSVLAEKFPAVGDPDAMEAFEANMGEEEISLFDLDQVKVPGSGGRTWEVPSLTGIDSTTSLDGVILAIITRRSYWESSFDDTGGGTPPDCASDDGVYGRGAYGVGSLNNPDGECKTCPMNQWVEDDKGRSRKPCTEQRLIVFLREGDILPVVVQTPPTSLKPLKRFMMKMASSKVPYHRGLVKITLTKIDGAQPYSVLTFALDSAFPAEGAEVFKRMGDDVKSAYEAATGAGQVPSPASSSGNGSTSVADIPDDVDDGGGISLADIEAARAEAETAKTAKSKTGA